MLERVQLHCVSTVICRITRILLLRAQSVWVYTNNSDQCILGVRLQLVGVFYYNYLMSCGPMSTFSYEMME